MGESKRGSYSAIYRMIWTDKDFQALPPETKLVFFWIRTSPFNNTASIFLFFPEAITKHTGLSLEQVFDALTELKKSGWIDFDDQIIWVKNGLKYEPGYTPNNTKHQKGLLKLIQGLPTSVIVDRFISYYTQSIPILKPIESQLKPNRYKEPEPEPEPEPDPENEKGDVGGFSTTTYRPESSDPLAITTGFEKIENDKSVTPELIEDLICRFGVETVRTELEKANTKLIANAGRKGKVGNFIAAWFNRLEPEMPGINRSNVFTKRCDRCGVYFEVAEKDLEKYRRDRVCLECVGKPETQEARPP